MSLEENGIKILKHLRPFGIWASQRDSEICVGTNLSETDFNEALMYLRSIGHAGGGKDGNNITTDGIKFLDDLPLNQEINYLELQKLRGEVDVLTSTLVDYDKVKDRLKRNEIVSWSAAVLMLIDIILQLKGCKGG